MNGSVHFEEDMHADIADDATVNTVVTSVPCNDLLTVFQASPLACVRSDHQVSSIDATLDLALEEQILVESLKDARTKVELVFETATPETLGSFLARGEGHVMHISCHGHRDYLALDNGFGALHPVGVQDLHAWIQAGGRNLDFVFVSACFSRSAGDAFVQAGVPHVVCCQDDSRLADNAAIEFTRAFYHALASGNLLDDAFEFARQQVMVATMVPFEDRHVEMQKFALLPVDTDHHVPVFTKSLRPRLPRQRSLSQSRFIPLPPDVFEGRKLDVYKVLDALKNPHVIRVTGPPGIGKLSLVKSACFYHRRTSPREDLLWVPSLLTDDGDALCVNLMEIYGLLKDMEVSEDLHDNLSYRVSRQKLVYALQSKRAVIVVNTKNLPLPQANKKLCMFLEDLVQGAPHVRVIVIHNSGDNIPVRKCPCRETDIVLEPLDLEATVTIFGIMCPHVWKKRHPAVSTAGQLYDLLLPQDDDRCFYRHRSKRSHKIFKMLGEGNPEQIRQRAKNMTAKEYDKLIRIGLRPEQRIEVSSRVALERRQAELVRDIDRAVLAEDYRQAQGFQEALDEIEVLFETMPNLKTLESMRASLKHDQYLSVDEKDFDTAAKLQEQLECLDAKIKIEKDAYVEYGIDENMEEDTMTDENDSRAFVEARLRELESQEQEACQARAFQRCRELRRKINEVEVRLISLPTIEELRAKSEMLEVDIKSSMRDHNYDKAEYDFNELASVQARIRREEEAEEKLGIKRASSNAGAKSREEHPVSPPGTSISAFFRAEHMSSPAAAFPVGSPLLRNDAADDPKFLVKVPREDAKSSALAEDAVKKVVPALSKTASAGVSEDTEKARYRRESDHEKSSSVQGTIVKFVPPLSNASSAGVSEDTEKAQYIQNEEQSSDFDRYKERPTRPGAVAIQGPDAVQGDEEFSTISTEDQVASSSTHSESEMSPVEAQVVNSTTDEVLVSQEALQAMVRDAVSNMTVAPVVVEREPSTRRKFGRQFRKLFRSHKSEGSKKPSS